MKAVFIFALVVCFLGMIAAQSSTTPCPYTPGSDGKPDCAQTGLYRNNNDPTRYWDCVTRGQAPVERQCDQQGWSQAQEKCVDWSQWNWTPPCNPPTS